MSFQIVQCEIQQIVSTGYSGNELLPIFNNTLGKFETKSHAETCLKEAGFSEHYSLWYRDASGYGYGQITRFVNELK